MIMRINFSRFVLGPLVAACLSSGCMTTKPDSFDSRLGTAAEMDDANKKLELPAKDASRACLATAQLLDKQGKCAEAAFEYEKAIVNDPSLSKTLCRRLAVIYDYLGDFAKADREYEKALALHPKDAALLNDVGYSHYLRGEWTLAEDYLSQAVKNNPDQKTAWINLGMTLVQRDRLDQALDAFNHAVPEPEAHCNMAFAFSLQGKHREAIQEYRRALELAPNLEKARAALAKLENPSAGKVPAKPQALGESGAFAAARVN
jgi:Tfp pilus assembly protein PilF